MQNNFTKPDVTGSTPRTIRDYNRRAVIKAALERSTFSVADIASDVLLSRQSVMKALNYFLEQEMIVPLGKGSSSETGGKKPELYALRPPQRFITILHRTDELVFRLMDLSANILDSFSIKVTKALSDEELIEDLNAGSQKLLVRNPEAKPVLYGVSVAIGGLIDPKSSTLYRSMYFSGIMRGLPIHDIVRKIFPSVPCVLVDCIGRMAGQAALLSPELLRRHRRIFTLYMDRAITGCFFLDGKFQSDSAMMMVEVGHMVLDERDDEVCTCGRRGCAESLVSLQRMRRSIAEQIHDYPDSCLCEIGSRHVGFEDLFAGSRSGDALCQKEVRRLASVMGRLLQNIFLVCNPGLVVFMGNFGCADEVFDSTLRSAIHNDYVYTLRNGTYDIVYDHRDLLTLETLGCAQSMIEAFYDDDALYCKGEAGPDSL